MSHFKSFLLGLGVAYGVYYITRKGADGRSVLDELLENPKDFLDNAKRHAIADVVETVKENIKS
jgi:hypothetical protein